MLACIFPALNGAVFLDELREKWKNLRQTKEKLHPGRKRDGMRRKGELFLACFYINKWLRKERKKHKVQTDLITQLKIVSNPSDVRNSLRIGIFFAFYGF